MFMECKTRNHLPPNKRYYHNVHVYIYISPSARCKKSRVRMERESGERTKAKLTNPQSPPRPASSSEGQVPCDIAVGGACWSLFNVPSSSSVKFNNA